MAKCVAGCLTIVIGIRDILWSKELKTCGDLVCHHLFEFLTTRLKDTRERGLDALHRFIDHALDVTCRYGRGLFHCYDDLRIPQTSNSIEGLNGDIKRNLRRAAGRSSTANGPGSSLGRTYAFGVALHACLTPGELEEVLRDVPREEYRQARQELDEIRAPAKRRRSHLRNPDKNLTEIVQGWLDT